MRIAVTGAGNVGGTLGRRWAALGHQVTFGVRQGGEVKGGAPPGTRVASVADACAGAEVIDRYAFALLVCKAFRLDASRLTPVTTAALGQKAVRPLDGGLRVAKAQAQLTTRLLGPAEGLAAMRDALERGGPHVDQPGNMK